MSAVVVGVLVALAPKALGVVTVTNVGGVVTIHLGAASDTSTVSTTTSGGNIAVSGTGLSPVTFNGVAQIDLDFGAATQTATFNSSAFSFVPAVQINTGSGASSDVLVAVGNTLKLMGAAKYGGGTTITGTLQLGNGGTTGSIIGNVLDKGTLIFDQSDDVTFTGIITGTGAVTQNGNGVLTLSGNSSYSGGTNLDDGTIKVTKSSALGTGIVNLSGGTELTSVGSVTLNQEVGLLQVGGSATVSTTGTLTLHSLVVGDSTLVFGSAGHAGTVVVGPASSSASAATVEAAFGTLRNGGGLGFFTSKQNPTTVDAGATLSVNDISMTISSLVGAGNVTLGTKTATALTLGGGNFSGAISGSGKVIVAGVVTLTGTNTYTGGTTISSGGLLIGNGGTSGSLKGNLVNNSAIAFNRTDSVTFAGNISGPGVVVQQGSGTLVLGGNSNYSGGTNLNQGAIQITNSNGLGTGALNMTDGTELTGKGNLIVNNEINLPASGTMTISSVGTLTLNNLNLVGSIKLVFGSSGHTGTVVMGPDGATSGGNQIEVAAGTLSNGGGTFTGSATSTTVDAGATLSANNRATGVVNLLGAGKVTLGTKSTTQLSLEDGFFRGIISGAGGVVVSNQVALTGANTYTGGTTVGTSLSSGASLLVGDASTTGSIVGNVTTVNGGVLIFGRSNDLTFGGAISGDGKLIKQGVGVLTLSGKSTYSGGTDIQAGKVSISNSQALGTGPITVEAGTELIGTGKVALPNVDIIPGATVSSTGALALGGGSITGHTVFGSAGHTGVVSFSGPTTSVFNTAATIDVAFGTLRNDGGLSFFTNSIASTTVEAGAALAVNDHSMSIKQLLGAGSVTLGKSSATVLTLREATFDGVISGAGQVNIIGATTVFTGNNTYAGGTTISSTLKVGNGGATGSIVGDIIDNNLLTVDRSGTLTLAGVISGTGSILQDGPGTLQLTGHSTYAGGTTIEAGKVSVNNSQALGIGVVQLLGNTELTATGTVTLANEVDLFPLVTNTVSATGTLSISKIDLLGQLVIGSAGHTGVVAVAAGTSLVDPGTSIDVAFGTLRNDGGLGTFTNGVDSTTVNAGATLNVNDHNMAVANLLGTGKVVLGKNSGTQLTLLKANFSGVISGAGQVVDAGPVTLTGANTYTGGTVIQSGVTVINNTSGSGTGKGSVTVDGGSTLGGSGKIAGSISLLSGGIVEPGAGSIGTAGTILHGSSLVWTGGGSMDFQVGAAADELVLSGALTKGSAGTFVIDLLNVGVSNTPENFTLMTFASTNFSLSDFVPELPVGVTGKLALSGTSLTIENLVDPPVQEPALDSSLSSLPNDAGNELTAGPAPEPASGLLLALGGVALIGRRRRQKKG